VTSAGAGGDAVSDESFDATGGDDDDDAEFTDVTWVVTDEDDDADDVDNDVDRDVTGSDVEMAFCFGVAETSNNDLLAFLHEQVAICITYVAVLGWRYRPKDYAYFNQCRFLT